ncbi:MAG: cytidylate kinase-like family protein [Lachnospiraceae bacterium]|nr:cytidylate kinase-like family protein [Lachnospiraceae bacterium]
MNKVITIGRQYGSGGRDIGRLLAQKLEIPFYDNELISRAAKESGFSEESFERAETKATNSLLYSLAMGVNVYGNQDFGFSGLSLDDRIFLAQSDVIRKVAKEGPCVIVGKCADYVLKDQAETFNIFVKAAMDFRLKRAVEVYGDDSVKVGEKLTKMDKSRANYYKYHVGERWTDLNNYDLVISSDMAELDDIVDFIVGLLRKGE